jgi:CRP/FNR family transcriptional regulator
MSNAIAAPNFQIWRKFQSSEALPAEDLNELEPLSDLVLYPPGTVLFEEEEEPQKVFLLLTGNVKLTVNSMDGKRFILHLAGSGEIVGLASALTGTPYEMTAETIHLCRLASIKREKFLHFLKHHPAFSTAAALALAGHYHDACARFRTLAGTPSVTAKLARFLLELASAYGWQSEKGTKVHLRLTQMEIGECVGACRETVSRSLRELRKGNLIAIHGSIVTITDRASLEICAGS